MITHRSRALNIGECFTCSKKNIVNDFIGEDLVVFWGMNRAYSFDFYAKKHIEFKGKIIAAISINTRDKKQNSEGILSFFPIKESEYCEATKMLFVDEVLPSMRKWLYEVKKQQDIMGGCHEFLVELRGDELKTHVMRYT